MSTIDKKWHLAQTEAEIGVTEFELQLWRVFYGFLRWQEECEKSVNGTGLTGNDLAVLHVIRMKDKPKTIYDVGRLLNRDDNFNIHYSVKKLLKIGLIEKAVSPSSLKKPVYYQATQEGVKNTNAYTEVRRSILIDMFLDKNDLNLEELTKTLIKLKSIYDEADMALRI